MPAAEYKRWQDYNLVEPVGLSYSLEMGQAMDHILRSFVCVKPPMSDQEIEAALLATGCFQKVNSNVANE